MDSYKFIALKPFNNRVFYNNAIFNGHAWTGSAYLIAARKLLAKNKIHMDTIDVANKKTEKDIYFEAPYPWEIKRWFRVFKNIRKNILFIGEPPLVNPFSFMKIFHIFFSKIYTWNDNLVNNDKYFKYFLPKTSEGIKTNIVPFNKKQLVIMMNANQLPFLPFRLLSLSTREFYTERIKAIDFFESYYPTLFSLYGRGWNKPQRFSIKQKLFGFKKYSTYQGEFSEKDKYKILSKFKFCLCFENNEVIGYISEKIIDCFKGRCVPVYFGAPNIGKYINKKCFIDFRKFNSYQELFEFLEKMDEETHSRYLTEIEKSLSSKKFWDRWSVDAFAKQFLKAISQ